MKKLLPFLFVLVAAVSCNSGSTSSAGADSANTSAPSAIKDTSTQAPNGITSDGVISTDTSGFGVKAGSADTSNKKKP